MVSVRSSPPSVPYTWWQLVGLIDSRSCRDQHRGSDCLANDNEIGCSLQTRRVQYVGRVGGPGANDEDPPGR